MKRNVGKKALSGLLTAVCAISLLVIPVSAEEALSTTRIPGGTYLAEKQGENVFIERIWTYDCPANPGQKHQIAFHNAAPTCTESDYIYNYCTICGEKELYAEKAALGHDYQLTGSAGGVDTYTCSRCGASYTQSSPSLPSPSDEPASQTGLRNSGDLNMKKLSAAEITRLLEDAPLTLTGEVFDAKPSVNAPYATGTVKASALQAAVNRLNAVRRIAGLPGVTLDTALSQNAQYGAVLTAHNNYLDHYPAQPADMDQSFYTQAKSAVSSSNLSAGRNLPGAVDAFMDDSDASNIDRVGHRRWQLNPVLGKVGFGYAVSGSGYGSYVVEKVFDKSGSGCDYDFISWPASGNFPAELFDGQTAWSITLNPKLYGTPSKSGVTVTLTRDSDGKSWTFSSGSGDGFFNVDTGGYGVSNCIIFRPNGVSAYDGSYTVRVQGLKTQSGQVVADFTYQVDFFSNKTSGQQPTDPADPTTQPGQGTQTASFRDVPASHWASKAVEAAVSKGIVNGYPDGAFHPNDTVTNAQFSAMISRAFYPEELKSAQAGTYWWSANVAISQTHGLLDGTGVESQSSWGSQMEQAISRYDMAQMMYNLLRDRKAQLPTQTALQAAQGKMADWQQIPAQYRDAVSACYALGLLNGLGNGTFGGQSSMDRAQGCMATYRLLEYLAG